MELFGFGPHLMVDGYEANPDRLRDAELIRRVLNELPEEMEMTKVLPPFVYSYGPGGEDGVTGVVIIAESHIAIHTFPKKRFLSVDIFSCKAFDMAKALKKLAEVDEVLNKLLQKVREAQQAAIKPVAEKQQQNAIELAEAQQLYDAAQKLADGEG